MKRGFHEYQKGERKMKKKKGTGCGNYAKCIFHKEEISSLPPSSLSSSLSLVSRKSTLDTEITESKQY